MPSEESSRDSLLDRMADHSEAIRAGRFIDLPADLRAELAGLSDMLKAAANSVSPTALSEPPARVGPFEIVSELGAGGFGIVYLAWDTRVNRRAALKVPHVHLLFEPSIRQRFLREGRAAALLEHPNVVPLWEIGDDGPLCYIASAYVEGPTLARYLAERQEPLPSDEAADFVAQLADGMQHAHERGVLHCDLKPGNVLLAENSTGRPIPKITDFGLARLLDEDGELSRSGDILGTPAYMAPEQVEGRRQDLTARADVYALGVILYEMLTGATPFAADSRAAIMNGVLNQEPAKPRNLRGNIPKDLEAICLKCLEKKPGDRYPSAAELAAELRRFAAGQPTLVRPPGVLGTLRKWVGRNPAAAGSLLAAAVVLLLVIGGTIRYNLKLFDQERIAQSADERASTARFFAALEKFRQRRQEQPKGWTRENLDALREMADAPAAAEVLPDVRSEAIPALTAIDSMPFREVGTGFWGYYPAYHPDGKRLFVGSWAVGITKQGQVIEIDTASGATLRTLTFKVRWASKKPDGVRALAVSPDGRWLAAGTRGGDLHLWDLHSAETRAKTAPAHDRELEALYFSRDSRTLFSGSDTALHASDTAAGPAPVRSRRGNLHLKGRGDSPEPLLFITDVSGTDGKYYLKWIAQADFQRELFPPRPYAWGAEYALNDAGTYIVHHAPEGIAILGPDGLPLNSFAGAENELAGSPVPDQLAFSPDQSLLAVCYEGAGIVRLVDIARGRSAGDIVLPGRDFSLRCAFAPDGRQLAISAGRKTILYELRRSDCQSVVCVTTDKIREFAAAGSAVTTLGQIRAQSGTEISRWRIEGDRALRTSNLLIGRPEFPLRIWLDSAGATQGTLAEVNVSDRVRVRLAHADGTTSETDFPSSEWDGPDFRFGSEGSLWGLSAHEIRRWKSENGTLKEMGRRSDGPVDRTAGNVWRCLGIAGDSIYAGRRAGSLHRFDYRCGNERTWTFGDSPIESLATSPAGDRVFVGTEKGELMRFDPERGEPNWRIAGAHSQRVSAVAILEGGLIASASPDGRIRLWSEAGVPIATFPRGAGVDRLATQDGILYSLSRTERGLRRIDVNRVRERLAELHPALGW